ncbi:pentapeptide repeat-containing protein [Polymorphospora rubra]|uniref:Pentapeptide repeat-containing protein n=1 Tax=Polymorphospora rubra TaxID=338584 RepID=A0A810MSK2_9ACTN|nr:pentapeptide repeat-containing protein [Polymorphospora rubra]BCJ63634.1 hypothetical protein Prubr_06550 [Polymorphospora rubra]
METRTIRDLGVLLPGDESDDLDPVERLPRAGAAMSERTVSGDVWTRAELDGVTVGRTWFVDADLDRSHFDTVTLDRCAFRGCSVMGVHWENLALRNVIFENCRLDYATFTKIKTSGPVAFLGCSLTETTFAGGKLAPSVFDNCRMAGTTFDGCDLRGADLRGNDLSGLDVVTDLRGVRLSAAQLPALTELIVRTLAIRIDNESP